jgi:hypothetical protein
MALNAKELTDLSKESMKARLNVDRILDFVDVINKNAEELEGDPVQASGAIKELADKIGPYIVEIKDQIETQLNGSVDRKRLKTPQKLLSPRNHTSGDIMGGRPERAQQDSLVALLGGRARGVMQLETAKQASGE